MRRRAYPQDCTRCGAPMVRRGTGNTQTEEYSQGMHKACYEWVRRHRIATTEARIFPLIRELDEATDIEEYNCLWCEEGLYFDKIDGDLKKGETNEVFAWFMDEAICKPHAELALEWARFILKERV